jgi:hypothetical protein
MSGPANKAFASPNFAFPIKYDEVLVRHAALAERYVFDDPNGSCSSSLRIIEADLSGAANMAWLSR